MNGGSADYLVNPHAMNNISPARLTAPGSVKGLALAAQ